MTGEGDGNPGESPPSSPAPATVLEEAWTRVLEGWEEDEAHRKFIALAASLGALPEAGRRYRAERDGAPTPEHRRRAEEQMEKLLAAALSSMQFQRTPPPKQGKLLLWIAFVVMLAMIIGVTLLATSRMPGPQGP